MKITRVMLIFSLVLLLFFLFLIATQRITGKEIVVEQGIGAVSLPILSGLSHRNLKKQLYLDPETAMKNLEIWNPVRIPASLTVVSIAVVDFFVVITYPDLSGYIAALIIGFAALAGLAFFIRKVTKLPWKAIFFGNSI